jgi:AbrB family looped-hinge helix DNA binding protein
MAVITLSCKGQVVIPKEIRDALHWAPGSQLSLVTNASGVTLKLVPNKTGHNLADLIGFLHHEGEPLSTEELCAPMDYAPDWQESEKRSR